MLGSISVVFLHSPWWLLLFVPAVVLTLLPYFRVPKKYRRNRNRIVPLLLHMLILSLCIGLISGVALEKKNQIQKNEVIILVDHSYSASQSGTQIDEFIQDIIAQNDGETALGIVTFGKDCIYAALLSRDTASLFSDYRDAKTPNGDGTDFAYAIDYACGLFTDSTAGRIILLTDGLETDGATLAAIKNAASKGVQIDIALFSANTYQREIQILSLTLPQNVVLDRKTEIRVTLVAKAAGSVVLTLFDNKAELYAEPYYLVAGINVFTFSHIFTEDGLHELCVTVTAHNDTVEQNNCYYTYADIKVFNNVLIVEGKRYDSNVLDQLLSQSFLPTVVRIDKVPLTIGELRQYDEIILLNVANEDMPAGFDTALSSYVRDYGGGLMTAGGDKAYMQEDMEGTLYEDMLPVISSPFTRPLALMLVIDASSSMDEPGYGTESKLDLAKQGAIACVNALNDRDYVGVISFNSTATEEIGLTPVTFKQDVIAAIKGIQWKQGTKYYDAIDKAGKALQAVRDTDLKHIIFITDGSSQDGAAYNYKSLITHYNKQGITTSTIAVGSGLNTAEVENMAALGKGRYYYVKDPKNLPAIMEKETKVNESVRINETPFEPEISLYTPVVAGITRIPTLGGYYSTKQKSDATVILSKDGAPIYAVWQYGLGLVGSFMCDLKGDWSNELFAKEEGIFFINNAVKGLLPNQSIRPVEMYLELSGKNFEASFKVITPIARTQNVHVTVTGPDGSDYTPTLTRGGTAGTFSFMQSGVYTIYAEKIEGDTVISALTVYAEFSYSAEYDAYNGGGTFVLNADALSEGGGILLSGAEGIFNTAPQYSRRILNPRYIFLTIAVCLFLVEIAARKFKFKWPHEIVRYIKERHNQKKSAKEGQ